MQRRHWMVVGLCIFGALIALFTHFVLGADATVLNAQSRAHEIPPAFVGNRWFYGTVLALMLSMTALLFLVTIENIRYLSSVAGQMNEPAKVTVMNETVLLIAVIVLAMPDTIQMLAWGEISAPSNSTLAELDRAFDGLSAFIFGIYLWRRVRTRPVLLHQLHRQPIPVDMEPTWEQIRPKVRLAAAVIIVSFGVAFGK